MTYRFASSALTSSMFPRRRKTNTSKRNTHIMLSIFFTLLFLFAVIPQSIFSIAEESSSDPFGFFFLFVNIPYLAMVIVEGIVLGIFIVLNSILAYKYQKKHEENPEDDEDGYGLPEDLRNINAVMALYPSLTREELSEKADIPQDELEEKLVELALSGSLKGHIDPGTERIISGSVNHGIVRDGNIKPDALKCPYCFAALEDPPVKGTSTRCSSCGELIVM